jgi:hypothetical protein
MIKSKALRVGGFVVAVGLTASLVGFAAQGTGAYFSDTSPGTVSGTVGSIHVVTQGGTGASSNIFSFDRLLPGAPQTVTISYTNTGNSAEDVYLTFPNATALSALNSLGTYGNVQVNNAGGQDVFDSQNLNDGCLQGSVSTDHPIPCKGLPKQLQVASGLAPNATGTATFAFGYASKLSGSGGGVFNAYPVLKKDGSSGQNTVNSTDGSGDGLPFATVATQVGQQP